MCCLDGLCKVGHSRFHKHNKASLICHYRVLPTKVRIVKVTVFPVVMYRCESWIVKKAECQLMLSSDDAGEDLLTVLEMGLGPVHPKENQPWIFTGRTDAEAKAPILWPPDGKSQLIGKNPDAGED